RALTAITRSFFSTMPSRATNVTPDTTRIASTTVAKPAASFRPNVQSFIGCFPRLSMFRRDPSPRRAPRDRAAVRGARPRSRARRAPARGFRFRATRPLPSRSRGTKGARRRRSPRPGARDRSRSSAERVRRICRRAPPASAARTIASPGAPRARAACRDETGPGRARGTGGSRTAPRRRGRTYAPRSARGSIAAREQQAPGTAPRSSRRTPRGAPSRAERPRSCPLAPRELGAAQLDPRVPREPAAEQTQSVLRFVTDEAERGEELTPCQLRAPILPEEPPEVHARHREGGIEVRRGLVVSDREIG